MPDVQREIWMKNDDAYDNRGYIPDAEGYIERWSRDAAAFRDRMQAASRADLGVGYGPHPRQALDLFHPAGAAAGLAVFIHGGYWRLFDRSDWSHLAEGFCERGWAVALPSYPLAPEAGISEISRSAAAAVTHAAERIDGPIVLAGHSAGGHLAARMVSAGTALPDPVAGRLHHVLPISPVSDLRPLIETSMNADFGLDDAAAQAESPALLDKVVDVPVTIFVGAAERPAFLDQARWLAEAWGADRRIVPGRHHFDIVDGLRDPDGKMVAAALG